MDSKQKRIAFIVLNILLVGIVGLVLGLCLPVGSNQSLLLSMILLLVTLCAPSFIFLLIKDPASGIGISSILFFVGNVVALIVFLCLPNTDMKVIGITEGAIVGAYILVMLVNICFLPKKEENK